MSEILDQNFQTLEANMDKKGCGGCNYYKNWLKY